MDRSIEFRRSKRFVRAACDNLAASAAARKSRIASGERFPAELIADPTEDFPFGAVKIFGENVAQKALHQLRRADSFE